MPGARLDKRENDRTVNASRARLIPSLIPNAELQIIKNGTHSMMYLQGALIANRISQFCSSLLGHLATCLNKE
jgi:pimeloyl-ACP methyl ester carboxylesterase